MTIFLHEDPRVGLGAKQLPLVYSRDVQLEAGPSKASFALARGRHLALLHHVSIPFVSLERLPSREWIAFIFPLSWDRVFRINGIDAEVGVVHLVQGANGFVSSARHRVATTVGIHRDHFLDVCAAIGGVDKEDLSLNDCLLHFDDGEFRKLVARLHSVLSTPHWTTTDFSTLSLPQTLESDLLCDIVQMFYPRLFPPRIGDRKPATPMKLVFKAQKTIEDYGAANITTAHLCKALGVGYSRLHVVFHEVYGESPHRYLTRMRLSEARAALLNAETPPRSVKEVALGFGFTKSGRFAERYHELFGEYPSETLNQATQTK